MSKVKQLAYDTAEKAVDKIIMGFKTGIINKDSTMARILDVDNVNMLGIDENNVDDVLYYAKEDYNSKRGKEYWGGLKQ